MPNAGKRKSRKWLSIILAVSVLVAIVVIQMGFVSRPEYDPEVIAKAETEMWKAYYSGDKKALASELLILQSTQFELTWMEAAYITGHLAKAAALRDAGRAQADWEKIEQMLTESYTVLLEGI